MHKLYKQRPQQLKTAELEKEPTMQTLSLMLYKIHSDQRVTLTRERHRVSRTLVDVLLLEAP